MAEGQTQQQVADQGMTRIVAIAIDGSDNAKFAFDFYIKNVRRPGDKVYLIHSVEINSVLHSSQWYSSPYSFDKDVLLKLLEDEKEKIRHKLEGFSVLLKDAGVDGVVKSIHAESPGEGLCKAAIEVNANLIVIGTRGMGKIRRTFIGSVSDYVLHHAHVPVLVCRSGDHHDKHDKHDKHNKK